LAELGFTDEELAAIERQYPEGVSSDTIIGLLGSKGIKLTEATLRKYVQQGLLPRSRRVRLADGSRGSQGRYPSSVVRRIQCLRTMMAHYTIDEIKEGPLFVRGDVEELEQTLERIFGRLAARAERKDLGEARRLASALVEAIARIEARLVPQRGAGDGGRQHELVVVVVAGKVTPCGTDVPRMATPGGRASCRSPKADVEEQDGPEDRYSGVRRGPRQ
jgi:DNA-binding transcriptional MerR regulator